MEAWTRFAGYVLPGITPPTRWKSAEYQSLLICPRCYLDGDEAYLTTTINGR